jgi:hypothetical protein
MSTTAQQITNIINSLKSTGPKTPDGKKRSSLNAIRHNLTGQLVIVQDGESEIYQKHCKDYRIDFAPKGKLELDLTQQLADLRWSMNRITAYETNLLSVQSVGLDCNLESGDPEINSSMEIANAMEKNMKILALLSVYEQRKQRAFDKVLAKLQEIQIKRKAGEAMELHKAARYRKVFQNEEPDWKPAQDGFVCSEAQLETYIKQSERAEIVYCAQYGKFDPRDRDHRTN